MLSSLFLLLPLAALSGWYFGCKKNSLSSSSRSKDLPSGYFLGLNYLINEQPDKAVDVFIKMLDVDSETAETHLALGSLFRRRGEVDRAIRIHQNLIARPQLDKQQRAQALFELGQDYMRAGLLDRAERIFVELVEGGDAVAPSLVYLKDIYQQQKDWEQAMQVAQKLENVSGKTYQKVIAHHCCELAQTMLSKGWVEEAQRYLKRALSVDKNCVRANLMLGAMAVDAKQHKLAISHYKAIKNQNHDYLPEIIQPLQHCFEQMNDRQGWLEFLKQCLIERPSGTIVIALAEAVRKHEGHAAAIKSIAEYLLAYPGLRSLGHLTEMYLDSTSHEAKAPLSIVYQALNKLQIDKPEYACGECGFNGHVLYWLCPGCKQWGTIKPEDN